MERIYINRMNAQSKSGRIVRFKVKRRRPSDKSSHRTCEQILLKILREVEAIFYNCIHFQKEPRKFYTPANSTVNLHIIRCSSYWQCQPLPKHWQLIDNERYNRVSTQYYLYTFQFKWKAQRSTAADANFPLPRSSGIRH